ncbi:MAG: hypothetical protein OEV91_01020 [Desulfobulbaceae bacterium]|nr:hypothetical protein [Desulfobulbaceae bacterium]
MPPAANQWVASRRHLFIRNLLKEFFETFDTFSRIYGNYITLQEASFAEIDRLVGTESRKGLLWQLKDSSHRLWQQADPKEELHGCLLDWALGSLFHEAMKLKENIYMYQYYRPLAEEMGARGGSGGASVFGVEGSRFIERTGREIGKQMESIGALFGRANYLLRLMVPEQADNHLLARLLVEEEELVATLWGESIEALFAEMYPLLPESGFCTAGRSYLADQWHERAHHAFQRALAVNSQCEEAQRHLFQLRAMLDAGQPAMSTAPARAAANLSSV